MTKKEEIRTAGKSDITIAFLTRRFTRDRMSYTLWSGISDMAREENVNLVCFPGNAPRSNEGYEALANPVYDLVNRTKIDGLVIWASGMLGTSTAKDMKGMFRRFDRFPMVSIGLLFEDLPSVIIDNYRGMYEACAHLIRMHGSRKMAFLRGPTDHQEAEIRFLAYQTALEDNGIPFDENLVYAETFRRESGIRGVRTLLDERKAEFDAIAASNDILAIAAMDELQARGIAVPDEVRVVGFDDLEESSHQKIPLSTVKQPFYEMGRMAMKNMIALVRNEEFEKNAVVTSRFIERGSCGCSTLGSYAFASRFVSAQTREGDDVSIPRAEVVSSILGKVSLSHAHRDRERLWIERLTDSFANDIAQACKREFLSSIHRTLLSIDDRGGIDTLQAIVTALWGSALQYIRSDRASLVCAESLWHQSQILIRDYYQRMVVRENINKEIDIERLLEINQRIVSTYDLDEFMDLIADALPLMGIPSCYLSLYENPEESLDFAKLMLAYANDRRIDLPAEGIRFRSDALIPEEVLPDDKRLIILVEPLYFEREQLGFVVFEARSNEGIGYDVLQSQLSATIKGALLFRERDSLVEDLEKRAQELEAMGEELRRSNENLEKFCSVASHDLEEPLAKIRFFGEKLKETFSESLGERGKDYVARMQNASLRMSRLITDLLAYSKISAAPEAFVQVDLATAAREVIDDLEVGIAKSRARVEVANLPVIEADPSQIRQLFQNIVSNAIKFSKTDASPEIRIGSRTVSVSGREFCEIAIEDNGIGIEEKNLERIFGIFERLHGKSEYEGTGIGLAICRKVAERHGGTIRAESIPGEGTRILVTLPFRQAGA